MCFSIKFNKNSNQLSLLFNARISEKYAATSRNLFRMQEQDLPGMRSALGLSKDSKAEPFKLPDKDDRIFSGGFTDVIVMEEGELILKPMRFHIRPTGSKTEVPNLYNARIDKLDVRENWQRLYMRKHCLIPFKNFYENVEVLEDYRTVETKRAIKTSVKTKQISMFENGDLLPETGEQVKINRLITFHPGTREIMWAIGFWDEWISPCRQFSFMSFALITDDPPHEVLIMGHDRCPIFIKRENIIKFLNPDKFNRNEMYEIMKQKEPVIYNYSWA